jgi:transcriptional regulator GlxA family with amidase domain
MTYSDRIVLITYPGAELMDVTGPSAVFSMANRVAGRDLYAVVVASPDGASVAHSCGIQLLTVALESIEIVEQDTVLVVGAGAADLAAAVKDLRLQRFLQSAAQNAGRHGSICTGVFLLGAADLLSGKTIATHWAAVSEFSGRFEDARCEANALYVVDGRLWTSAGVTTGIDMSLAMVERDHGAALKAAVARQLVVYSHRPGHQSQFSDLLAAQCKEDERFAGLVNWLQASTGVPVSVEQMADRVCMSPRSFHRRFTQSFGQTPARFFEKLRLNAARDLLEAGVSVADAAREAGFRSEAAFRTAFKSQFGVTPQLYRESGRS